jgi:acetyltransferase-like isoleucine patch superfamily enzyme
MDFIKIQSRIKKLKGKIYSRLLKGSVGGWGHKTTIYPPFWSNNLRQFFIGNNCQINPCGWIDCVTQYCGQEYSPRLEIGDNAYIGHRVHIIVCGNMKIGNDVIMADGVYISDNLHGYDKIDVPIEKHPLTHPGPVTIGDQVWLGENVCVLPNVTIGRHSVIGANSVVTKDIPDYCVAVGSPARVIKRYNHEKQQWEKVI